MRHALGLISLTVAFALAAMATAAAHERDRSCGSIGFEPATEYGAFDIQASKVSCGRARTVARASRPERYGPEDGRTSARYRSHGFLCRGKGAAGSAIPSLRYTCRGANGARIRFTRGA